MRSRLLALFLIVPALLHGQAKSAAVELKSSELAQNYALYFPGGGYLYTGETVRGVASLGITAFAGYQVLHVATCNLTYDSTYGSTKDCSGSSKWLWVGLAVAPYVYGIFDAHSSADRVNARLRAAESHALLDVDNRGRLALGARLSLGQGGADK